MLSQAPAANEQKEISNSLVNGPSFFSNSVPTPQELDSLKLLDQYKSIEDIKAAHPESPAINYLIANIKKLHGYVVENLIDKVIELLNSVPKQLLPILLKTPSQITTSCLGLEKKIIIEGTALQMALAGGAMGRSGCEIFLCKAPSEEYKESDSKCLNLYLYPDLATLEFSFLYMLDGKEWLIEEGEKNDQLSKKHYETLNEMFQQEMFDTAISLDTLAEDLIPVYIAILKITSTRKHTEFVVESGMVDILLESMRRTFNDPVEFKAEALKQTLAQFPENWEALEEKQFSSELAALNTLRQVIAESTSLNDPKLISGLNEFRSLLEPDDQPIRTGRYGKGRLLNAAFHLGHTKYYNVDYKDRLYANQVLGYIQRFEPDYRRQAVAQGLEKIEAGNPCQNSLKCSSSDKSFIINTTDGPKIGYDCWVDARHGAIPYYTTQIRLEWAGTSYANFLAQSDALLKIYLNEYFKEEDLVEVVNFVDDPEPTSPKPS